METPTMEGSGFMSACAACASEDSMQQGSVQSNVSVCWLFLACRNYMCAAAAVPTGAAQAEGCIMHAAGNPFCMSKHYAA